MQRKKLESRYESKNANELHGIIFDFCEPDRSAMRYIKSEFTKLRTPYDILKAKILLMYEHHPLELKLKNSSGYTLMLDFLRIPFFFNSPSKANALARSMLSACFNTLFTEELIKVRKDYESQEKKDLVQNRRIAIKKLLTKSNFVGRTPLIQIVEQGDCELLDLYLAALKFALKNQILTLNDIEKLFRARLNKTGCTAFHVAAPYFEKLVAMINFLKTVYKDKEKITELLWLENYKPGLAPGGCCTASCPSKIANSKTINHYLKCIRIGDFHKAEITRSNYLRDLENEINKKVNSDTDSEEEKIEISSSAHGKEEQKESENDQVSDHGKEEKRDSENEQNEQESVTDQTPQENMIVDALEVDSQMSTMEAQENNANTSNANATNEVRKSKNRNRKRNKATRSDSVELVENDKINIEETSEKHQPKEKNKDSQKTENFTHQPKKRSKAAKKDCCALMAHSIFKAVDLIKKPFRNTVPVSQPMKLKRD